MEAREDLDSRHGWRRGALALITLFVTLTVFALPAAAATVKTWGAAEKFRVPVKSNAAAVDIGDATVVLRRDGKVVGPSGVLRQMRNIIAVARGNAFTAGLRADGKVQVVVERMDLEEVMQPPAEAVDIVAIDAGPDYILALRSDGTPLVWGSGAARESLAVPQDLEQVVAIAAGGLHCLALRSDGTVVAWGSNSANQTQVPSLGPVTAIAAGAFHSLALQEDGRVIAWGRNDAGQTQVPAWDGRAIQIAAGGLHSMALLETGNRVVAWGSNMNGQSAVPADLKNVTAIAAGATRSAAVCSPVSVLEWKSGEIGSSVLEQSYSASTKASGRGTIYSAIGLPAGLKLNRKTGLISGTPTESGHFTVRIRARSAKGDISRVVSIFVSGTNPPSKITLSKSTIEEGRPAGTVVGNVSAIDPDQREVLRFEVIPDGPGMPLPPFSVVNGELRTTAPLDYETQPVCHVSIRVTDSYGLTMETTFPIIVVNRQLDEDGDKLSDDLEARYNTSDFDRDSDDDESDDYKEVTSKTDPTDPASFPPRVVVWGTGTAGDPATVPTNLGKVKQIVARSFFHAVLRDDGSVQIWGAPPPSNPQAQVPTLVPNLRGLVTIVGYGTSLIGLRPDGTLVKVTTNAPNLPALTDVVALAAGPRGVLMLRANGEVVQWGATGTLPQEASKAVGIAVGHSKWFVLRADGAVVSWDYRGLVTVPAELLSGVVEIAAGEEHLVALKADGSTVVWSGDQLPVQNSPYVALDAGYYSSTGVTADGSVVTVGRAAGGTPMPAGLKNVTQLSVSFTTYAALVAGPLFPRMPRPAPIAGTIGVPFSFTPEVSHAPTSFSAMGLPPGLSINAQTGEISGIPTTVGAFSARVMATNSRGTGHQILHFRIAAGPNAPTAIALSHTGIEENMPVWAEVGSLLSTDADAGDLFSYELVSGEGSEDNGSFRIVGDRLESLEMFDFETKASYSIRVRTTDVAGLRFEQSLRITILNSTLEDSDKDGLSEGKEEELGMSDFDPDFDRDEVLDGVEFYAGYDPKDGSTFPAQVINWGPPASGLLPPPASLPSTVAIAAAGQYSLALNYDGTVKFWGNKATYPTTVGGAVNIVKIVAGNPLSVGLRADGTIQILEGSPIWKSFLAGIEEVQGAVAVSVGYTHAVVLKSDSTVVAFGQNTDGCCNVPPGLRDVVAVAAAVNSSAALTRDGQIVVWGSPLTIPAELQGRARTLRLHQFGILAVRDDGKVFAPSTSMSAGLTEAIDVDGEFESFVALKADGTVTDWNTTDRAAATPPTSARNLIAIAVGQEHRVGLRVAPAIRFTSSHDLSGTVNQSFQTQLAAEHATSFAAVCLPQGLVLDSATGVISGVPTQVGAFRTLIVARNEVRETMETQMVCIRIEAAADELAETRLGQ